jgi:hypothetical protein
MQRTIRSNQERKILIVFVIATLSTRSGDIEDSLCVLEQGVHDDLLIGTNSGFLINLSRWRPEVWCTERQLRETDVLSVHHFRERHLEFVHFFLGAD